MVGGDTMTNNIKYKIGLFFHDHLGWHRPLEDSICWPCLHGILSIYKFARCKYCGKRIMEASDLGDWMVVE